ncbi:hypothetical protein L0337_01070 [candidate division KSB1 bacterium]|nr:hypothetical protein [candidate division KSB1 bacterium]
MKKVFSKTNGKSRSAIQKKATELLEWMIDFLPAAILPTLEKAVLDESGEVHALFWHRSELQYLLTKEPEALNALQLDQLADLDKKIRASALLLYASEKGTLQRYRQGRYDHSHWWWYLDDLLQEELMAKRRAKLNVSYPFVSEVNERMLKVAEPRAPYGRRTNARKKESK